MVTLSPSVSTAATAAEHQHTQMVARHAAQRASYSAFLSAHPYVSPLRISFIEFILYPSLGVIAYDHPLQGLLSIPCLAGPTYPEYGFGGSLRVQVIALNGTPFVKDGLWSTPYLTTAATRFTPGLPGNVIL